MSPSDTAYPSHRWHPVDGMRTSDCKHAGPTQERSSDLTTAHFQDSFLSVLGTQEIDDSTKICLRPHMEVKPAANHARHQRLTSIGKDRSFPFPLSWQGGGVSEAL